MCRDFAFAWPFGKTEVGNVFHTAMSFDSVPCIKSETMIFLATRKGKDSISEEVRIAVVHGCYYFSVAKFNF